MNFLIIFKSTLSIWLLPVLFVSLFTKSFHLFTNYILYILLCYLIFFTFFYFTERKIFFYIDRLFLLYFSLAVFAGKSIYLLSANYLKLSILIIIFILGFYILLFYYFEKRKRAFQLNFKKLSCIIELLFILSIFMFGISSDITTTILFTAAIDIIYKILILIAIGYLKKKFKN